MELDGANNAEEWSFRADYFVDNACELEFPYWFGVNMLRFDYL